MTSENHDTKTSSETALGISAPGAVQLSQPLVIPTRAVGAYQTARDPTEPASTVLSCPPQAEGISRRTAIMNMVASTAAITSTATALHANSVSHDPIFEAIENHKAALAALEAGLDVMYALEAELPKELRKSNIDIWEEVIVETDDPRWIECEKNVHALFEADQEAAIGLINVEPTTLAGLAALMRHVAAYEATGNNWPSGLQDDDDKPRAIGKDWEVYLHRNIVALLDTAAAAQAA